jgi:hypothetical protein
MIDYMSPRSYGGGRDRDRDRDGVATAQARLLDTAALSLDKACGRSGFGRISDGAQSVVYWELVR